MPRKPRTYSVDGQEIELPGAPLDSAQFQSQLAEMIKEVRNGGWLFILRNKLPFALIAHAALHHGGVQLHFSEGEVAAYVRGLLNRGDELYRHHSRVSVIVPVNAGEYFQMSKALLLPRAVTPSGAKPDHASLKNAWVEFLGRWSPTGALRIFDPERRGSHPRSTQKFIDELEMIERADLNLGPEDYFVNFLPDLWMCMTRELLHQVGRKDADRVAIEEYLCEMARNLAQMGTAAPQALQTQLDERKLLLVRLSGSEINPRFRGLSIVEAQFAARLIVHSALAYGLSGPAG